MQPCLTYMYMHKNLNVSIQTNRRNLESWYMYMQLVTHNIVCACDTVCLVCRCRRAGGNRAVFSPAWCQHQTAIPVRDSGPTSTAPTPFRGVSHVSFLGELSTFEYTESKDCVYLCLLLYQVHCRIASSTYLDCMACCCCSCPFPFVLSAYLATSISVVFSLPEGPTDGP